MEIILQSISDSMASFKLLGHVFYSLWFWILPMPSFFLFRILWLAHIQNAYAGSINWILLEIIPPKEIEKSPKLMESIYIGMTGVEKSFTTMEEFSYGLFTTGFSMEIVGENGNTHFYIRTHKGNRNLVESFIYAHYPDTIIKEVPDYVENVPKFIPNEKWDLWGTDFEFTKDDAYPIRTYKYFEEDVTGKMIDPLGGIIEVMGKLPPGQHIWFQIIAVPTSPTWSDKEGRKLAEKLKGRSEEKESVLETLGNDIKDVFSSIWKATFEPVEFAQKDKKEDQPLEFRLSPGEREILRSIEEGLGKATFKVKMRFVFLGRKDNFDKSFVSAFIGGLKQFNDNNFNSLKPDNLSKTVALVIFEKIRLRYMQRKIFRRYCSRSTDGVNFIMNTEELATIFHLPDMSIITPALERVDAKRGGAPSNLPVE